MDHNDHLISYTVGTLNFSSTMISPYQFHQVQSEDQKLFQFQLNDAFHHFALEIIPNFDQPNFEWGFAAIDLIWKERYSPLYKLEAGVGSNGKMMNERQFGEQWNKEYYNVKDKIIEIGVDRQIKKRAKLSREDLVQSLKQQILLIKDFDLIAYKAFIKVIYGIDDIRTLDVSSQKYLSVKKTHFNKNYLHEEEKRNTTVSFILNRNYDIFCMQQCSHDLIKQLRHRLTNYLIVEMSHKLSDVCESIILLKKSTFPDYNEQKIQKERQQFLQQFTQFIKNPGNFSKKFSAETVNFLSSSIQLQKPEQNNDPIMKIHRQLFWNDDTCYAIVGPFIIFSPHISTKVRINQQQINSIKKAITKLITYFPDKHFICAGDLNGNFENQLNFETPDHKFIKVNAFPYHHDDVTCYKMRTLTQAQKRKALAISFCKKDYIITDLKITQPEVIMADGTEIHKENAQLIPNDKHPFDHYIVSACLRYTQRILSCSPLRRKKMISSPWDGFNLDESERNP